MNYKEVYNKWLTDPLFNEATKAELRGLTDQKEIEDRFYRTLEFGTGGLRGVIGAGTNRMNIYVVGAASQGFANYINKNSSQPSMVISYDCRRMSKEFAHEAALVFCANGIKTYLFSELHPVPLLSFAIRYLKTTAGVIITASHNPPEYNGYKAYWSDGAQVTEPHDTGIIQEVNAVDFGQVKTMAEEDALKSGLLVYLDDPVDEAFTKNVLAQSVHPEIVKELGAELKIVYTPLHGSGNKPVRKALSQAGFSNVSIVKEQEQPDGNFPTVASPNPENPEALKMAIELASQIDADIVIGTDPDADRVGTAVKNDSGQFVTLSGNIMGGMLCEYILSQKNATGTMPKDPAVISTIVSTRLGSQICKAHGVDYFDTLTGFKFIGRKMLEFDRDGSHNFIFGFEESYGYLAGDYCRDKDSVVSCMLICELCAFYKKQGKTLWQAINELYEKYGYYIEETVSITLKGIDGAAQINAIMDKNRQNPPLEINGKKVIKIWDYETLAVKDYLTGARSKITEFQSNVLRFELDDETWFAIRPSGTEPKIKIYYGVVDKTMDGAKNKSKIMEEFLKGFAL